MNQTPAAVPEPVQAEPCDARQVIALTSIEWCLRYKTELARLNDGDSTMDSSK